MPQGRITNTFIQEISERVKFEKEVPASILRGSVFRHYGDYDPAGLCDGGDYIYEVQIRIENEKGDIYIHIQPRERSEWWSGKLTWKEFFDIMMKAVKNDERFEHHEH